MKNKGGCRVRGWESEGFWFKPKTGMVGAVEVLGHFQSTAQVLFSQVCLDAQSTCLGQLTHNFPLVIALNDPAASAWQNILE